MSLSQALGFTHEFVAGPANGSPRRTLLLLHGTAGNECQLLNLGHSLDRDAALLSPRGKVLENGMPQFFRILPDGALDEVELVERANELAAFIDAAAERYGFDPCSVLPVGYSNGANMAAALLFLHAAAVRGAILLRPKLPLVPSVLPDLMCKPVVIGAGNQDPLVPVSDTERLAGVLRRAGADVTVCYENSDHSLVDGDIECAIRWLARLEADELGGRSTLSERQPRLAVLSR
jgi:phospholipase/carboxylesterase